MTRAIEIGVFLDTPRSDGVFNYLTDPFNYHYVISNIVFKASRHTTPKQPAMIPPIDITHETIDSEWRMGVQNAKTFNLNPKNLPTAMFLCCLHAIHSSKHTRHTNKKCSQFLWQRLGFFRGVLLGSREENEDVLNVFLAAL